MFETTMWVTHYCLDGCNRPTSSSCGQGIISRNSLQELYDKMAESVVEYAKKTTESWDPEYEYYEVTFGKIRELVEVGVSKFDDNLLKNTKVYLDYQKELADEVRERDLLREQEEAEEKRRDEASERSQYDRLKAKFEGESNV